MLPLGYPVENIVNVFYHLQLIFENTFTGKLTKSGKQK